jgi:hypothetical protein
MHDAVIEVQRRRRRGSFPLHPYGIKRQDIRRNWSYGCQRLVNKEARMQNGVARGVGRRAGAVKRFCSSVVIPRGTFDKFFPSGVRENGTWKAWKTFAEQSLACAAVSYMAQRRSCFAPIRKSHHATTVCERGCRVLSTRCSNPPIPMPNVARSPRRQRRT